ncbi:hypothetical protein RRG08_014232 [Elysia crispata]|uniref:Uncharacterized protein n=1 Tax=Elysia crispata TaxID=231223 RepID=A0AAE0XEY0_9GAST|nr:hypothetical protein RRG08_014232 [Elysia crispata]
MGDSILRFASKDLSRKFLDANSANQFYPDYHYFAIFEIGSTPLANHDIETKPTPLLCAVCLHLPADRRLQLEPKPSVFLQTNKSINSWFRPIPVFVILFSPTISSCLIQHKPG